MNVYRLLVTRRLRTFGIGFLSVSLLVPRLLDAQGKIIESYTLPDIPLKDFQNAVLPKSIVNDRKVLLGSIGSDLWRSRTDHAGEFWMISDRGPNGLIEVDGKNRRTFWVPEFNPAILRVKLENNEIRILQTIPILDQDGKAVTGLPNRRESDETPFDYSGQHELECNINGIDPEGLVRTTNGDFWISEEYSPSLLHVDPTGKVLKRYVPEGVSLKGANYPVAQVLPAIYAKRKVNRGFEGLTMSSDGKRLYAALQSPLLNPDKLTGESSRNTRLIVFDVASEKIIAEYVYRFEVAKQFDPGPTTKPDEMKLSGPRLSKIDVRETSSLE